MGKLSSYIDAAVSAMSPEWGLRRAAARAALSRISNSVHEGAESDRLRAEKWIGSRLSPDAALEMDLETLRHRSREIYRNDSLGGAIDNRVVHVVGTGFTVQARTDSDKLNKEQEKVFKYWARHCDRSGRKSLWQVQTLGERCFLSDGESLIVMSDRGGADKPIPLTLEVVDVDRLETPPGMLGNPLVRMGVERDRTGRIIAYHIRRSNPYDNLDVSLQYDRVPAERVLHRVNEWFPGQSRGYPWMTRVLNRIKDVKDLDEAAIIRAQVEACFSAFVKSNNPLQAAQGAATDTSGASRLQDLTPGTIRYLGINEDVTFSEPTSPGSNYQPFQELNHRRIAAGMNWGYEHLVKNWTGLSFAGGRLALTDTRKSVKADQRMCIEQNLTPIWERAVAEMAIVGATSLTARQYASDPIGWSNHFWMPPAWEYAINPSEEIKAKLEKIKGNLGTLADALAEEQLDYDETMTAREKEVADQTGRKILPLDQQPEPPPAPVKPAKAGAAA